MWLVGNQFDCFLDRGRRKWLFCWRRHWTSRWCCIHALFCTRTFQVHTIHLPAEHKSTSNIRHVYVQPVTLPEQGEEFTGTALVSGWGRLNHGGEKPTVHQKVDVPIVSDDDCRRSYGADSIDDSMMCAGETGWWNRQESETGWNRLLPRRLGRLYGLWTIPV